MGRGVAEVELAGKRIELIQLGQAVGGVEGHGKERQLSQRLPQGSSALLEPTVQAVPDPVQAFFQHLGIGESLQQSLSNLLLQAGQQLVQGRPLHQLALTEIGAQTIIIEPDRPIIPFWPRVTQAVHQAAKASRTLHGKPQRMLTFNRNMQDPLKGHRRMLSHALLPLQSNGQGSQRGRLSRRFPGNLQAQGSVFVALAHRRVFRQRGQSRVAAEQPVHADVAQRQNDLQAVGPAATATRPAQLRLAAIPLNLMARAGQTAGEGIFLVATARQQKKTHLEPL